MNKVIKTTTLGICLLLSVSNFAHAHRVLFENTQHPPAVTVKAFFSRTSPLADAAVTVLAPGSDQPWQTGRTDKAGNFTFLPDQTGEWVVRVDDERGHVGRSAVNIAEAFFTGTQGQIVRSDGSQAVTERFIVTDDDGKEVVKEVTKTLSHDEEHGEEGHRHIEEEVIVKKKSRQEIPVIYRIIFGLALIVGITGFVYGWKARQYLKK